jgi:hypothetical protein
MSRDNRKQVRLTDTEMATFTAHCSAMGIAPGTMLRHLVLGWLAQRTATKLISEASTEGAKPSALRAPSDGPNRGTP